MGGLRPQGPARAGALTRSIRHDNDMHKMNTKPLTAAISRQMGKIGYILLWLLGVPLPVLFLIYLLRGCS